MNIKASQERNAKEIKRLEKSIENYQAKLKFLYKERVDLENLAMIDILRKNKIKAENLSDLITLLSEENGGTIPLNTETKGGESSEKNKDDAEQMEIKDNSENETHDDSNPNDEYDDIFN